MALDFETTGVNVAEDRIIEIGAVLYDATRRKVVHVMSLLVNPGVSVSEDITSLTGITNDDLQKFGKSPSRAIQALEDFAQAGDVQWLAGHNGLNFDRVILDNEIKRHILMPDIRVSEMSWIDTLCDLPYDTEPSSNKLQYVVADHGFLNPFPHRALFDSMCVIKLIEQYELDSIIMRAKSPAVVMRADVDFNHKEDAKKCGFRWQDISNGKTYTKQWVRLVKECDLRGLESKAWSAGFRVVKAKED